MVHIETNAKDFRLVELVLDIAKYLKVPVVAEGVETESQIRLLRNVNCELVQGYYFSKPLPPEEFEKLIIRELEEVRGKKHDHSGTVRENRGKLRSGGEDHENG